MPLASKESVGGGSRLRRHPTEASVDTLPKHRPAPYRSIGRHPDDTMPRHRPAPYRSIGRHHTEDKTQKKPNA